VGPFEGAGREPVQARGPTVLAGSRPWDSARPGRGAQLLREHRSSQLDDGELRRGVWTVVEEVNLSRLRDFRAGVEAGSCPFRRPCQGRSGVAAERRLVGPHG
jgi:hypothetical protein